MKHAIAQEIGRGRRTLMTRKSHAGVAKADRATKESVLWTPRRGCYIPDGEEIARLRASKGFNQENFAAACGFKSKRVIENIENAVRRHHTTTIRTLTKIANVLEVPIAQIVLAPSLKESRKASEDSVPGSQQLLLPGTLEDLSAGVPYLLGVLANQTKIQSQTRSHTDAFGVVVAYPTIRSNHPPGTLTRFRSLVKGLQSDYIMEGPDEVVAARDLLGVRHVLDALGGRFRPVDLLPHSSLGEPSLWPEKTILAIGGPVSNEVVHHVTTAPTSSPILRFDASTQPWSVSVRGMSQPFFSANRRDLDYGFAVLSPHPRHKALHVLSLFGIGSPGTEAACYFLFRHPGELARLLQRDGIVVLKVVKERVAHAMVVDHRNET